MLKSHVHQTWREVTRCFSASHCTWHYLLDQRYLISSSLCHFLVRFIGTFLLSAVFMKKLYTDISYYIWKRFLSTKRPKLLINTVNQFMKIVIFAARLCRCLRFLTQVSGGIFQVEIFNCGRVTRSPCLDGKDPGTGNYPSFLESLKIYFLAQIFARRIRTFLVSTL